jgi:hypothetical protein
MTKSLNPADAFRKQQRKKELKKAKVERQKANESKNVKKDIKRLFFPPDLFFSTYACVL